MNSSDLGERGFTIPIPFNEGNHKTAPVKTGIYIITLLERVIEYPVGSSDIVKIGKVEFREGFRKRWYNYHKPGLKQETNKRLKPKFDSEPHGFAWLVLEKGHAALAEKRLLSEFMREHSQYPPYNKIHG